MARTWFTSFMAIFVAMDVVGMLPITFQLTERMQPRERRRVIQVIRTTYDPELKRGRSKVVGKIEKATPALSDKLRRSCTPDELAEITTWLAQWTENLHQEAVRSGAATLADQMRHAAEFFRSQRTGDAATWAAEIRDAWGPLEKALRKVDPAKPPIQAIAMESGRAALPGFDR